MTKRDSAKLFALLLKEEYDKLFMDFCNRNYEYYVQSEAFKYWSFLRKQAEHDDAYCPYARAIKLIGN